MIIKTIKELRKEKSCKNKEIINALNKRSKKIDIGIKDNETEIIIFENNEEFLEIYYNEKGGNNISGIIEDVKKYKSIENLIESKLNDYRIKINEKEIIEVV